MARHNHAPKRYLIEQRYQDSKWGACETYDSVDEAVWTALIYAARHTIAYGMTRVIDLFEQEILITFPATNEVTL